MISLPSWDWVITYASSAVELSGAAIGSIRWRRIAGGQRVITLWFAAAAIIDIAVILAARRHHSTQPLIRLWVAVSVIFALEALGTYQRGDRRVAAFRALIVAYVAAWLILLITIEPLAAFSTYSAPLHTLVILAAAVLTLRRRASFGRGELFTDPGFLIAAGLAGYAVADAFETLVAQLWVREFPQYVVAYYTMCNVLTALAEFVIIKALFLAPSSSRRSSP